jgi:hypothetical protein
LTWPNPLSDGREATGFPWRDAALASGLTALSVVLRLNALGPSSLWIDDAWATLVIKAHTVHDVLLVAVTAPGFAVLLKGWLALVGFSELKAQLLPFIVGVATPPLLYIVLRRGGVGRLGAALGALVLVASVVHMTYSTRVKEYTLDGFVAVVVLTAAWWLIRSVENSRRWWVYTFTCLVAIALASPAIVLVASSTGVALALLARESRHSLRIALAPTAVMASFAALWWWLLLRPHVNEALKAYWSGYYVPHNRGLGRAAFVAARDVKDVAAGGVPLPAVIAALAVAAAVATLLFFRRFAPALLFVITPLALALALAAGQAAPLGTGRTDLYLYPGLAMAIALAVDEFYKRSPRLTALGAGLVVAAVVITFNPVTPYPPRDLRPLVAQLEHRASPSDTILIRPDDDYAFALYTSWPVTFVRAGVPTGFAARIDHPNVHVPLLVPIGPDFRTQTWQDAIARAEGTDSRVWLLVGGHSLMPKLPDVRRLMRKAGLSIKLELDRPGANLTLWSRNRVRTG